MCNSSLCIREDKLARVFLEKRIPTTERIPTAVGENYGETVTKVDEDGTQQRSRKFSMRKLGIFLLSRPRDVDFERVREAYLLVGVKFEKVALRTKRVAIFQIYEY